MAVCTIATRQEGLGIRAIRRYTGTVGIMTGDTRIMRLRIRAYKRLRIGMTAGTVCCICLHQ